MVLKNGRRVKSQAEQEGEAAGRVEEGVGQYFIKLMKLLTKRFGRQTQQWFEGCKDFKQNIFCVCLVNFGMYLK